MVRGKTLILGILLLAVAIMSHSTTASINGSEFLGLPQDGTNLLITGSLNQDMSTTPNATVDLGTAWSHLPLVYDFNGDGEREIIICITTDCYVYDNELSLVGQKYLGAGAGIPLGFNNFQLFDYDVDGDYEIILTHGLGGDNMWLSVINYTYPNTWEFVAQINLTSYSPINGAYGVVNCVGGYCYVYSQGSGDIMKIDISDNSVNELFSATTTQNSQQLITISDFLPSIGGDEIYMFGLYNSSAQVKTRVYD